MSNTTNVSQNKQHRLGRGLGSLLGGASQGSVNSGLDVQVSPQANNQTNNQTSAVITASANTDQSRVSTEARIWQIPIEKIVPSSLQPRTTFDKDKLQELASSIKQSGILQPIVARKLSSGAFEIIAGERRWRAAQIAGLFEVPVILKTLSNLETLELAIVENIQREDLSPLEEADAYQRLSVEFKLTQQQIADKVGKERATVANAMRLLVLPSQVKELLRAGQITSGHAKVLLSLQDEKQMVVLAKKITNQQLSVRKLEQEVIRLKKQGPLGEDKKITDTNFEKSKLALKQAQDELQKKLGTKVSIEYNAGVGKILLSFYSDDELTSLIEKLKA